MAVMNRSFLVGLWCDNGGRCGPLAVTSCGGRPRTGSEGVTPDGALRGTAGRRSRAVAATVASIMATPAPVSGRTPAASTATAATANTTFAATMPMPMRADARRRGQRRRARRRRATSAAPAIHSEVADRPDSRDSGSAANGDRAVRSPRRGWRRRASRSAAASRELVGDHGGRVAMVAVMVGSSSLRCVARTPRTLLRGHCQIDAERCQSLPAAGQRRVSDGRRRTGAPRRSAAITRAAAFCQLCSDRCGTSVTNHCHA